MPFVRPETISNPTTAQPILASWGDAVDTALDYVTRDFPHCSIFESTAQSIPNATETDLTSNEERSDIGGMHSTSSLTERITIPSGEDGLYVCRSTVQFAAAAAGSRVVKFVVNNTTEYLVDVRPGSSVNVVAATGARSIVLAAGDYVTCRVNQDSGGALNVTLLDFSLEWRSVA